MQSFLFLCLHLLPPPSSSSTFLLLFLHLLLSPISFLLCSSLCFVGSLTFTSAMLIASSSKWITATIATTAVREVFLFLFLFLFFFSCSFSFSSYYVFPSSAHPPPFALPPSTPILRLRSSCFVLFPPFSPFTSFCLYFSFSFS